MSNGDTVPPSLLDKPLRYLTEDDISQLTREDCRRFLKEKGMRRPSWNKSQAIQQVISLKTLLETPEDSEAEDCGGVRKKFQVTLACNANERKRRDDCRISVPAAENLVPHRLDRHNAVVTTPEDNSVSPRTTAAHGAVEQMTIFYCGKVNVYDNMPIEKAHKIMHLAASPLHFPQECPSDGFAEVVPYPCHLQGPSVKLGTGSPGTSVFSTLQTGNLQMQREEKSKFREDNHESASSRKASVQRYREKRKDRFKRKVGMPSSTSRDAYLNHPGNHSPIEQLSRSGACSTSQPRLPNSTSRCNSLENLTRNSDLTADLNYKDDEDC